MQHYLSALQVRTSRLRLQYERVCKHPKTQALRYEVSHRVTQLPTIKKLSWVSTGCRGTGSKVEHPYRIHHLLNSWFASNAGPALGLCLSASKACGVRAAAIATPPIAQGCPTASIKQSTASKCPLHP